MSVGLDRHIKIWDLRQETRTHFINTDNNGVSPFPVLATAIDDQAEWIALLCTSGLIMLWNINERAWGPSDKVEIKSRTPLSFFFRPSKVDKAEGTIAPLVLIRPTGLLTEIDFVVNGENNMIHLQLCKSPLVCTVQFLDKCKLLLVASYQLHSLDCQINTNRCLPVSLPGETPLRIVTASRRGCVHLASQLPDRWISDDVPLYAPDEDKEVKTVLPLPGIGLFLAIRTNAVDLVHIKTHGILHTFTKLNMKQNTLQCFHSVKRKPHCGLDGLASFSLAYTDRDNGHLVLMTYIPKQEGDLICIGPKKCSTDLSCNSWTEARLSTYIVKSPGQWESLPSGAVVGVRRRRAMQHTLHSPISVVSSLRRRSNHSSAPIISSSKSKTEVPDVWEAWMISAKGERHSQPLYQEGDHQQGDHQLWVTACGPMTRVGRRSVAVGFGNVIKVITVGHEWWDGTEDMAADVAVKMGREKRRKHKHHGAHDTHGTSTPKQGGCCTMEAFGGGSAIPTPVKEKTGFNFDVCALPTSGSGSVTPTPQMFGKPPAIHLATKIDQLHLPVRKTNHAIIFPSAASLPRPPSTGTSTGGSCCGTSKSISPAQSPVNDGFVMVNAPPQGMIHGHANGMSNGVPPMANPNIVEGPSGKRSCAA